MEKNKNSSAMQGTGNKPLTKFKAGAISATIWDNQNKNNKGELISYKSVSFDRNYRDANGEWQRTNSLRMQDLPKAVLVLNKAFEFLALNSAEIEED